MSEPVKHRILLVDDEESIRDVFTNLMEHEGYEVGRRKTVSKLS